MLKGLVEQHKKNKANILNDVIENKGIENNPTEHHQQNSGKVD